MPGYNIHLWMGTFGANAAADYFKEHYSKNGDATLSQFVGDQGERRVDHDWMERSWLDEPVPVAELVERHLTPACRVDALEQAKEAGLTTANVLVLTDIAEVKEPRSIDDGSHALTYLGRFDNTPDRFSIEATSAAAEAGDVVAQGTLGSVLLYPPPELRHIYDAKKAEFWLLQAAEKGDLSSCARLYHVYAGKHGTAQPEKAFYWIRKAADDGWVADLAYLAKMYETGTGTARNDVLALKWRFLAECGRGPGRDAPQLYDLVARMSSAQIAEGERLALDWIETNTATRFKKVRKNPLQEMRERKQLE